MRRRIVGAVFALTLLLPSMHVSAANEGRERVARLTVTPAYGAFPKGLSVPVRPWESRVIQQISRSVGKSANVLPQTHQLITWYVEPAVDESPTFLLAREVLYELQHALEEIGVLEGRLTSVVVGRTQEYIRSTVRSLGCNPDMRLTFGQFLMGASVCGHGILVMNLTGYLVLDSLRPLTADDEVRPERPLAAQSYLVVDRNASSLAHEWVHSVRSEIGGPFAFSDEPTWFSEGVAELVSEIARVRAFGEGTTFGEIHAIKVRLFSDWPSTCTLDLRLYRIPITRLSGCEYSLGNLALELLVAEFGGLSRIFDLYRRIAEGGTFDEAFRFVFGVSLDDFEAYANRYIRDVASVGFGDQFRRASR